MKTRRPLRHAMDRIHGLKCTPAQRLMTAVMFQAIVDYSGYCKRASGVRMWYIDASTEDPQIEMRRIREFLSDMDDDGHLINCLDAFLKSMGLTDMYNGAE